jgi:hypothetical protein
MIDSSINKPLLKSVSGTEYSTISDIVRFGDHLDHFHMYTKPPMVPSPKQTIDFHTDEGLFITIAPAVMLYNGTPTETASRGKFLAKINGQESVIRVSESSLLFMLGDGVNQYVNTNLKSTRTTRLHAVEHALQMPDAVPLESRAWYGRMFLPPGDALNPRYGVTFGELRQKSVAAQGDHTKSLPTLGCSRNLISRSLAWGDACNTSTSLQCWMACVPFTDTLNKAYCASQHLGFNCTNDFDDAIDPTGQVMGSFRVRCTNSTTINTPAPTVAPLDKSTCSNLSSTLLTNYDYKKVLGSTSSILLWKTPVNGEVSMALVKDQSKVGYMSFGIANQADSSGCKGMIGSCFVLLLLHVVRFYSHSHAFSPRGHAILGVLDNTNSQVCLARRRP